MTARCPSRSDSTKLPMNSSTRQSRVREMYIGSPTSPRPMDPMQRSLDFRMGIDPSLSESIEDQKSSMFEDAKWSDRPVDEELMNKFSNLQMDFAKNLNVIKKLHSEKRKLERQLLETRGQQKKSDYATLHSDLSEPSQSKHAYPRSPTSARISSNKAGVSSSLEMERALRPTSSRESYGSDASALSSSVAWGQGVARNMHRERRKSRSVQGTMQVGGR